MTNYNRKNQIYLFGPPKQLAKVLVALGTFFALLPLVPPDYGLTNKVGKVRPRQEGKMTQQRLVSETDLLIDFLHRYVKELQKENRDLAKKIEELEELNAGIKKAEIKDDLLPPSLKIE